MHPVFDGGVGEGCWSVKREAARRPNKGVAVVNRRGRVSEALRAASALSRLKTLHLRRIRAAIPGEQRERAASKGGFRSPLGRSQTMPRSLLLSPEERTPRSAPV